MLPRVSDPNVASADSQTMSVLSLRRRVDLLEIRAKGSKPIASSSARHADFEIHHAGKSLWALATWKGGAGLACCLAHDFGDDSRVVDVSKSSPTDLRIHLHTRAGDLSCHVELPTAAKPVLHWRTLFRPTVDLIVPVWPRDLVPIDGAGDPLLTKGVVHAAQKGITGNMLFATLAEPTDVERGSCLYVQNPGALTAYFEQTKVSAANCVGGAWPEIGFQLPASPERPMLHGVEYVISDAYLRLERAVPEDEIESARLFLEMFADIYRRFPRPTPEHRDWPRRVHETIRDLAHSPECGTDIEGKRYAYAYAGSNDRPPESMVQLAVLVPMAEYAEALRLDVPLRQALEANLPTFFDGSIQTMARWLPLQNHMLKGQEEQMLPNVMDSWYLLHTCGNLARLAQLGSELARDLFLKSIDYCIKVAQRFDYQWPVFYDTATLEVIKAETQPGAGGEHDVGALYAHVMLGAYDLTKETRFVDEAVKAAHRLRGLGFNLGYQFNNVSFGAGTLFRLWKLTGDEQFKGLSDVCWANMVRNLWLWECGYGNAKHYSTFMGLAPLQDANYLALYEELEVLAAIHEYMRQAGDEVPRPLRVLLPEYCKFLIYRAWYHYPSELPNDVLADKPQSGSMHRYLSVPVEDLREGWEKAGQVGQEVYGASAPFIIATRHCHQLPGEDFTVHCNYPGQIEWKRSAHGGAMIIRLAGDASCEAAVRIVANGYAALPTFTLHVEDGKPRREVEPHLTPLGYLELNVPGDAVVQVNWDRRRMLLGETKVSDRQRVAVNGTRKPKRATSKPRQRG